MSFDFRAVNFCDHKVFKEALFLEDNKISLVVPRKVSSHSQFRLFVDGREISKDDSMFGYSLTLKEHYSTSSTTGSDIFRILEGNTATLSKRDIDKNTLKFFDNDNRSSEVLDTSFISVYRDDFTDISLSSSIDSSLLGTFCFVTYVYTVTNKELTDTALHEVEFGRFLPNKEDHVFEVSYTTVVEDCRKCNGFGYLNDLKVDSTGNFDTIENNEKLIQDSNVYVFTEKGSDPFYSFVGTVLTSVVGKPYIKNFTDLEIVKTVREALESLQDLQGVQSTVQDVTMQEKLLDIMSIKLTRKSVDSTFFDLDILVRSELDEELQVSNLLKFRRIS